MAMSEKEIQDAVVKHFENIGFVTGTQHRIQIGSGYGIADVVIYKLSIEGPQIIYGDQLSVIIECKAQGKFGHAKPQLSSYLCATDTLLGVIANSLYPEKWKYFVNYGNNNIPEIPRKQFESLLNNKKKNELSIQHRIKLRTELRIDREAKQLATETRIQERVESIIENEAKKRIYEEDFRSEIEKNLKTALGNSEKQITSLNTEISHKNGCLAWCIVALVGSVLLFWLSHS